METNKENLGLRLTVCFDDKAKVKSPITLENPNEKYLKDLNEKGYGIFLTANNFSATPEQLKELALKKNKPRVTKRNKEFLTHLNEVFADLDVCSDDDNLPEEEREKAKILLREAIDSHCPASAYVITKNGLQPRWWLDGAGIDEDTQKKYVNVTNGIIEWSKQHGAKGDPVKDVTRVLRIPGYYHLKSDPYLVTEVAGNGKVYTLDELKKYFWCENGTKPQHSVEKENDLMVGGVDDLDIRNVVIDVWKEKGRVANFDVDDRLIIDGVTTATFVGRLGLRNYMATTSGDYPAKGNAVTYVAETLGISTNESYLWLCEKYEIKINNSASDHPLETITAKELCGQEFPKAEWMIHRILPENQITVISGPPGSFKTMTTLDWAIAVAAGEKAYGYFETLPSDVLLVSEDGDHKRIVKKRIIFLTETPNSRFHLLIGTGFKVEKNAVDKLLVLVKARGIKFVIFDSFRAIMPSDKEENAAGAVREVINRLRPLTLAGATILIIHHDRKKPVNLRGYTSTDPNDLGEMMSGSVDIRGAVDCHLAIGAGKDKKENQFYIVVTQTKCREDELLPAFKVFVNKEKDSEGQTIKMKLVYGGEYKMETAEETVNKAKEAILEFVDKSTEKYVWRQTITENKPGGFAARTLEKALKALEEVDKTLNSATGKDLGKIGAESNRKYYFIGQKDNEIAETGMVNYSNDVLHF